MAITAKLQRSVRVLGMSLNGTLNRTGTDFDDLNINLPKGIAGTMTARANANQATFTLARTNHGFYPGLEVDLWFGNDPTNPQAYLNASVVSAIGNVIVLNTTNCHRFTSIPDSVGTSVVLSYIIGFDLSKIDDATQVKVMAYQSVFGKTTGIPTTGIPMVIHSRDDNSEPPIVIFCPLEAVIFDSEARFEVVSRTFANTWAATNYLYGTVSNPSATISASIHMKYLLEDLGS